MLEIKGDFMKGWKCGGFMRTSGRRVQRAWLSRRNAALDSNYCSRWLKEAHSSK